VKKFAGIVQMNAAGMNTSIVKNAPKNVVNVQKHAMHTIMVWLR